MTTTHTPAAAVRTGGGMRSLLHGIAWNGVAVAVTRLTPGILTFLLAWALSPYELGSVSFVLAYYGILVVVADCGISFALQKFIPADLGRATAIAWTALIVRITASLLLGGACWALDVQERVFHGYGGFLALLLLASSVATISYIYYAQERFREGSLLASSVNTVWLILAVVLVQFGFRITGPIAALSVAYIALGMVAFVVDPGLRKSFAFDRTIAERLIRFGVPATFAAALSTFLLQIGVLAVIYLRGEAPAAVFRVALTMASIPALIGMTIVQPFLPIATAILQNNSSEMPRTVRMLVRYLCLIGFPILAGGCILARPVLSTFFRPAYSAGALSAGILLVGNTCMMFFTALSAIPFMGGGIRKLTAMNASVAVIALLGNLVFIPRFGITGAAVAQTLACLVGLTLMARWLHEKGLLTIEWSRCGLYLVSAVQMSILLLAIAYLLRDPRLQLSIGIPVAALSYFALLFLQSGSGREDVRLLLRRGRSSRLQEAASGERGV